MFEIIKGEDNKRTVKFTEDKKGVQRVFADIRRTISKEMDVPGFRPGKIPRGLVERKYGNFIIAEAGDAIRRKLTSDLLDEKDWILEDTDLSKDQVLPVDGEPYTFEIEFSLFETPEPQGYDGIKVKVPLFDVDNAIEEAIEGLRNRMVNFSQVERAVEGGDLVHLTATSEDEPEESHEFDARIGENRFGPGFDELLTGLSAGDTFKARMSDGNDDSEDTPPAHTFEVLGVKEPVLPELDDEFAKNADLDSMDELRSKIRENIESRYDEELDYMKRIQISRALLESNKFDPPAYMINNMVEDYLTRVDDEDPDEETRESVRTMAEEKVREFLIMRAIAEKEDIQISAHEIISAKSPEESANSVADRLRNDRAMELVTERVNITEEEIRDEPESQDEPADDEVQWKWVLEDTPEESEKDEVKS